MSKIERIFYRSRRAAVRELKGQNLRHDLRAIRNKQLTGHKVVDSAGRNVDKWSREVALGQHPMIEFKEPQDLIHVHYEDMTETKRVHWDATYNLRHSRILGSFTPPVEFLLFHLRLGLLTRVVSVTFT